jgi:acyl-CoA dehydrogenase
MRRDVFDDDQFAFASVVRDFLNSTVTDDFALWEAAGRIPREIYQYAGDKGITGVQAPKEYGGSGESATFKFNAAMLEEMARSRCILTGLVLHMNVVMPYFLKYATDDQRQRWFPGLASGNLMTAIAMTEPNTGSDLGGIRTRARRSGADYILSGAKTFITGGHNAHLVIVVARTEDSADRRAGLSLIVVEEDMPGFDRGRNLEKMGVKSADTAELFFDEIRVPAGNLLGEPGAAFAYLSANLPQERLNIALQSTAQAESVIEDTIRYVQDRTVFQQRLSSFQNTKFVLADCATEAAAARVLCDKALNELDAGELSKSDAAMVKLFCTEVQGRVVDKCLQLYGGYGYMLEYPVARQYTDARVSRIYGGTSEVMKLIIAHGLGL